MDMLDNMERTPQWDNQQQIRNPNFRKNTNTGKSRESTLNQAIRPPFQENYAESSHQNDDDKDSINLMDINDDNTIFLTQEDHELYDLQQMQLDSSESFYYKQGYDFSINKLHKKYNIRSMKNIEPYTKKYVQTQTKKAVEVPTTKVLQILPRETCKTLFHPRNFQALKFHLVPKLLI